jgi:hypothetical protein
VYVMKSKGRFSKVSFLVTGQEVEKTRDEFAWYNRIKAGGRNTLQRFVEKYIPLSMREQMGFGEGQQKTEFDDIDEYDEERPGELIIIFGSMILMNMMRNGLVS